MNIPVSCTWKSDRNEICINSKQNQIKQGYKCGICGDPWQGPRHHEAGGKYAFGTIVRHFKQPGSVIDVFVQMTMNHMGWFEFRLCPHNDINTPATHECLDRYLLERADGKGTRYNIQSKAERNVTLQLRLPQGLTCSQCVLQWKWHCGEFHSGEQCTHGEIKRIHVLSNYLHCCKCC